MTPSASDTDFVPATIQVDWNDPANVAFEAIEIEAILHFEYNTGSGWVAGIAETKAEVADGVETVTFDITDESFGSGSYTFQSHALERVRIRTRIAGESWSDWVEDFGDLTSPVAVSKSASFSSSNVLYHVPGSVVMQWDAPASGSPVRYEAEATVEYEFRQGGAGAWISATYTESREIVGKYLNLKWWDRAKTGGSWTFQNHSLTVCRVRAINGDGSKSAWTDL